MIVTTKGEAVCDVFPIALQGLIWSITPKTWGDEQFIYEDESTKVKEVVKMVTQLDGYTDNTLLRKEMAIFLEVERPEIEFVRGEQVNSPSHYNKGSKKEEGLRFNKGKTRHDLVPAFAQEQYARVLTKGAEKYAERNWEKGMAWSKVLASMKRHILSFEKGEDYDPETGLLHMAHVMCNAAFLTEYYRIYPQGDDRPHGYLQTPKIGLDIDEVLADWVGHWTTHFSQEVPETWNFDRRIGEKFQRLSNDKGFWLSIPVKTPPSEIHFEPHCYITSRSIPKEWTEEWLDKNGFPTMPVFSVGLNESKVEVAKKSGIDIFVDDRFENFVELNNAGVCCFLFDAPHNKRYNVGYKRIHSLKELSFNGTT